MTGQFSISGHSTQFMIAHHLKSLYNFRVRSLDRWVWRSRTVHFRQVSLFCHKIFVTPVGFVGSLCDCETEILFNLNGTEPEQILRIRFVLFRMSFSVFGFQVCLCGGSGKTRKEQMKTFSNIHWNNKFVSILLKTHSYSLNQFFQIKYVRLRVRLNVPW